MRNILLAIILLVVNNISAQIAENFNDGDLTTNPMWQGETSKFKIDAENKLRLNAIIEGQALIYLPSTYADSFELKIETKMEFSPSATNATKLYFLLDNITDITKANTYYLLMGENGSTDAIRFYKQINGVSTLIASGKEGTLSPDPAPANIKILYRNKGQFTISADYDLNGQFEDVFTANDKSILPGANKFFAIQCIYTATRKDKFVFDNILLAEFGKDATPPELINVEVASDKKLLIYFNEPIKKSTAENVLNYSISNFGNPSKATLDPISNSLVTLDFTNPFVAGKAYTMVSSNVEDLVGNKIATTINNFEYSVKPKLGDLVLSEILFDPYTNEEDFIELYNTSDNPLSLQGIKIKNFSNAQEKIITNKIFIQAKSYLAITKTRASLDRVYTPPINANIVENELPAFNNTEGNVSIILADASIADAFDYTDKNHLLINDDKVVEGVSLEKINLKNLDNTANWASGAKAVKYATPGYANSILLDKLLPEIMQIQVVTEDHLKIIFNDIVSKTTTEILTNYNINNSIGNPKTVTLNVNKANEVDLFLNQKLSATSKYTIEVKNIQDKNKNVMVTKTLPIAFGREPKEGELVINEILFNPFADGEDFVEIYNASENNLQLQNLKISNETNRQFQIIEGYYILPAKRMVAISSDVQALIDIYSPPDSALLYKHTLPTYNLDKGNVSIWSAKGTLLDSFNYNQNRHHLLIDKTDVKGVSLEKIKSTALDNTTSNWHSAAKAGNYATPGYKNSNTSRETSSSTSTEYFTLDEKVFSPNGDAIKDILIMQYKLPSSGYIANIDVYNSEGFKVKNLTKNELLGQEGVITWDGQDDNGDQARMGIYIISGNVFDINGSSISIKKDCVLAEKIN
jgi:hypothetical protein